MCVCVSHSQFLNCWEPPGGPVAEVQSLLKALVQFLAGELRVHKPSGAVGGKKSVNMYLKNMM